ncbi:MAG: hypothetical protein ACM3X6_10280 [Patescibacteria group bacterium]
MSLVLALVGRNGMVLAGDSRNVVSSNIGFTAVYDSVKKIDRLTKYVGIGYVGAHALAMQLVCLIKEQLRLNPRSVHIDDVMGISRRVLRDQYAECFPGQPGDECPQTIFTLAGYTEDGTAKVYMLASLNNFMPEYFAEGQAASGIAVHAFSLLGRFYTPGTDYRKLTRLAAFVIKDTEAQDQNVGGALHIATILPDEGYREIERSVIDECIEDNEKRIAALRSYFSGGIEDA